jgi:hypothetical protein
MGKNTIKIDTKDIKIRKKWSRNPTTQIDKVKTDYNRSRAKREWQEELEEQELENETFEEDLF